MDTGGLDTLQLDYVKVLGKGAKWGLVLVLLLAMGDDMNQVFVVQVPGYIWGEGGEHLLHLNLKNRPKNHE